MSQDKVAAFAAKVKADPSLSAQLKKATDLDQVIGLFRSAGIQMTKAEFLKAESARVLALSDAELEKVHLRMYSTDTLAGCATWALTCTCPC